MTKTEDLRKALLSLSVNGPYFADYEYGDNGSCVNTLSNNSFGYLHTKEDFAHLAELLNSIPALIECAEALRNVAKERDLLSAQKSLELRRPGGSFGIAVKGDVIALAWQELNKELNILVEARRAALDKLEVPE